MGRRADGMKRRKNVVRGLEWCVRMGNRGMSRRRVTIFFKYFHESLDVDKNLDQISDVVFYHHRANECAYSFIFLTQ